MKQKIGLPAIIGAVVVLIGIVFAIYKVTLGANKDPDPAIAAPEHRDMAEFYRTQGHPGGGGAPSGATGAKTP